MENNISIIKQRILEHIKFQGISKRKFYQKTGISNGVLDKTTGLSEESIEKYISTYPEISAEWLLSGKGQMIKTENLTNNLTQDSVGIPLVSPDAFAGMGNAVMAIQEQDIMARYIVPEFRNADFMIPVRGDSMEPRYSSGDVVACRIIKGHSYIQWNKVHVISTNDQGIMIKRLREGPDAGCITAVSENSEYAPFNVPWKEITNIALVLGVIRLE